jgi:hypothetical protein
MQRSSIGSVLGVIAVLVSCKATPPPVSDISTGGECPTMGDRECKTAEDCGPEVHCTAGRCYANHAACPCSDVADCGKKAHCTKGTCFANEVGVPCSGVEGECGARAHCAVGTCYANKPGSPCSQEAECGPASNCVSGSCN